MKKPYEILKNTLSAKPNARIKLLGDSITHGFGGTGYEQDGESFVEGFARNTKGYCWANLFKKYMEERFGCSVVINACTGTRIDFIIEHFNTLVDEEDDLIFCAIGTNNRGVYFEEGYKPSREEMGTGFYNKVVKLYNMFLDAGKEIIFIANIPASAANEQDGATFWRILHMDDINAIYKAAADKLGFPLISFYDLFTEYCKTNDVAIEELLNDTLHPNDRGYEVMYNLILKELQLS